MIDLNSPPSFAMSVGIVGFLPRRIRLRLTGTQRELLGLLLYLMWQQLKQGAPGLRCNPSQGSLADACERSVWGIRKALRGLRDMRLISSTKLHKKNGHTNICRYYPGPALLAALHVSDSPKDGTKVPHNEA